VLGRAVSAVRFDFAGIVPQPVARNFDPIYAFVRFTVRNLVFRPFGGIRAVHTERIPMEGALIVAANHTSFADPPLVACSQTRRLRFMAKAELFKPVFGAIIRRVGAFPVHRGEADMEAVRTTLRLLAEGEAVLVFPEGARGDGKTLRPANKGVTLLARKSGAKVLPVGICDTDRWLPAGAKLPRRKRLTIVFGEPFTYADIEAAHGEAAKEQFGLELMSRIAALVREGGRDILVAPEGAGPLQTTD
jgi:1-acyl-sn-glycerol-3-phosphate acyltransferase